MAEDLSNVVTGTLQLKASLSADYNIDPGSLDSDLVAKFTQDLFFGNSPINMKRYSGSFTPADNSLQIVDFPSAYEPSLVLVFLSNPCNVFFGQNYVSGGSKNKNMNVGKFLMWRPHFDADLYLNEILLEGSIASGTAAQGVAIQYTVYTFEEV